MLSATELEQLTELAKKFEGANIDAVHGIIQQHMHPVFQRINDGGRTAANADNKAKIDAAEAKVTDVGAKLAKALKDLQELTDKTPDVANLRREYEQRIVDLTAAHKAEIESRDQLIVNGHRSRAVQEFVGALSAEFDVDAEYARDVLSVRSDILDRIRVGTDGKVSVLQKGQKELTITPAEGRTAMHHLAEEVASGVADKWKVTNVDRGPSITGTGSEGGKNRFDQIRETVKTKDKKTSTLVASPGLARLKGQPITAVTE